MATPGLMGLMGKGLESNSQRGRRCLQSQDHVDQLDDLFCEGSSKTCTRLIMVLMGFRNHISIVAESVRGIYDEWARTYTGKHTERLERFDVETQDVLLANWKK
ncbi:hypothetical protein TOPH_08802, partial [Tolypocladium ophioglossoides CBS 100239]